MKEFIYDIANELFKRDDLENVSITYDEVGSYLSIDFTFSDKDTVCIKRTSPIQPSPPPSVDSDGTIY